MSAPSTLSGDPGLRRGAMRREDFWAIICIVVATLPWWMAVSFPFIAMDDSIYISHNSHVAAGLTPAGLQWAFTTHWAHFWLPFTWLSLMTDATLFGTHPWGFHLTNVALHIANALLVYAVLRRMTGHSGRSLLVALLFAVHPLRVESVAWATERKDVLALFFGLLSLWFYAGYARRASLGKYLAMAVMYAMSLLAKPMLVTLPLVMLLLDLWPLQRWRQGQVRRVLLEKLPLLALAAAAGIVAWCLQLQTSANAYEAVKPLTERLANAPVSYVLYLRDTVYFGRLAIFYPWESQTPVTAWLPASLLLIAITAIMLWQAWKRPSWRPTMVGWLWFIGALVPMIGIVQSGNQSRADRFTYFPSIGLLIALVWAWPEQWSLRMGAARVKSAAGALVAVLAICMTLQLLQWRDPLGLYLDTLAHTRNNWFIAQLAAEDYQKRGDVEQAIRYYRETLRVAPQMHEAENNLGGLLLKTGHPQEALEHLRRAHELAPDNATYAANYQKISALLQAGAKQNP